MKRFSSLFLALTLYLSLFTVPVFSSVSNFVDVPADAWYKEELDYAVALGVVHGTSASRFSPDMKVTRGQFATMLGRALKVDVSSYTSTDFKDVDVSSWYGKYAIWLCSEGHANSYSSDTFGPNNNITFEQIGAILANYINMSGTNMFESAMNQEYTDFNKVSDWARDAMQLMAKYNLLPVDEYGNVRPQAIVLRSDAVVIITRLLKGSDVLGDAKLRPAVGVVNQPVLADHVVLTFSALFQYCLKLNAATLIWIKCGCVCTE